MHPLSPSLSDMSDQELHTKYNDLLARLNQAWQQGQRGIVSQLQMLMNMYKNEIYERSMKQQQEMAERSAKGKGKDGKGYSSVIDIM